MLFRFPVGFQKHPERAPGSIDEVRVLDGAAELDDVPASKEVPRGCTLVVRGWAFDPLTMAPAAKVVLTMDDRFPVEANYGSPREDIAGHFQRSELNPTGFKAMISTGGVALAPHFLKLYVLSGDGSTFFETSSEYSLEVVQARRQIPGVPTAAPGAIHVGIDEVRTTGEGAGAPAFPKVARGAILAVRGWAFDVARKMPCRRVYVALGDECVRAIYGLPRDDVAKDQQVASARSTGFIARLTTASLAAGAHTLMITGVATDGSEIGETAYGVQIEIVEPAIAR
jgi:hypothetical protein